MKIVKFSNGRYALAKRLWYAPWRLAYADISDIVENVEISWWRGDLSTTHEYQWVLFSLDNCDKLLRIMSNYSYGIRKKIAKPKVFLSNVELGVTYTTQN